MERTYLRSERFSLRKGFEKLVSHDVHEHAIEVVVELPDWYRSIGLPPKVSLGRAWMISVPNDPRPRKGLKTGFDRGSSKT